MPQSTLINLPAADDLAQQFREDIEGGAAAAGLPIPPTGKGTDWYLTSVGAGNIASIVIANQQLIDNDINPLTATGQALDDIRASDGLPVKPPVAARLELEGTVQGSVTVPAGLAWQGPGGVRGTIDTSKTGTSGTVTLQTTVTDTGSSGNLLTGSFVNFINPPLNLQTQAKVTQILSLGADAESDEDKRNRIMLARENPPEGGNWSQLAQVALASGTNADGAWVYPALGGPGATKVILTRTNATTPGDRTVDVAGINAVNSAYALAFPVEAQNLVVDTVFNQPIYVWLQTQLSTTSGAYWTDGASAWPEWPQMAAHTTGSTYTLSQLDLGAASQLTAGDVRNIAAWNPATSSFIQVTATFVSGTSPGPYTVTISGSTSIDGLQVCPWAPNLNKYASTLIGAMQLMGPGEFMSALAPRYRRAHRRPEPTTSGPYVFNAVQTNAVILAYPSEVLQLDLNAYDVLTAALSTVSLSPLLPASVANIPGVIVPAAIAFFPGT